MSPKVEPISPEEQAEYAAKYDAEMRRNRKRACVLALTFPIWLPRLLVWGLWKFCCNVIRIPFFLWDCRDFFKSVGTYLLLVWVVSVVVSPFLGVFAFIYLIANFGWTGFWDSDGDGAD
jgi:hypothetical protein